ncbi:MAG: AsmA family protein [Bauldia sp.]|nr:AsmA family protein [Bauldia sp.]
MKRFAIIAVVLIVVIAGVVIAVPSLVASNLTRERITEQIAAWIGRPVRVEGEPVIRLFPQPSITLEGVRILDASNRPFITMERLTGTVRLLPLLIGRVEVGAFDLESPTIALRVDAAGRSNWAPLGAVGDRVAAAEGPAPAPALPYAPPNPQTLVLPVDEVRLGQFNIRDGTITYEAPDVGMAEITDVDLEIAWPSTSDAATARGSLVWRGERVEVRASLAEPLELIAGRVSQGRFTLAAAPVSIRFDGEVGRRDLDFTFAGSADVTTASFRDMLSWVGQPMAPGATLGPARVAGAVNWAWPVLSFSGATMMLDGNEGSGAFTADFGGVRPRLEGTLAFDALNVTPYTSAFQADVQANGVWSGAPIDLPVLAAIDSDIRLSAATLTIGRTRIDGAAASAVVTNGRVSINLGEARLYGGRLSGTITAILDGPVLTAAADFALDDMNAAPALTAMVGLDSVAGTIDASLVVRGSGSNWGDLVAALEGPLTLTLVDGSVRGIDLAAAARAVDPARAALENSEAATAFTRIAVAATFGDGRVTMDSITGEGAGYHFDYSGWGSLLRQEIAGSGTIWLTGPDEPVALPFAFGGSWQDPEVTLLPIPAPAIEP